MHLWGGLLCIILSIMGIFKLKSKYKPTGDQPGAIEYLTDGIELGEKNQTLLGITGSGKTFTVANVIQNTGKPTLVLSHNKTLAAQLFSEFKEFFPENNVEYFVSYYDYYQPEAYVPRKDLYIEKEVEINDVIEKYRSSATQALLTKKDVIVVSTVSCIYGLGNPEDYMILSRRVNAGESYERGKLLRHLTDLQYTRTETNFDAGTFRVRGDVVDINTPDVMEYAIRLEYFGDEIESIKTFDPVSGRIGETLPTFIFFPAKAYVTPYENLKKAIPKIREDLEKEVKSFNEIGKELEGARLRQRVNYDLEMLEETGYTSGIENYSRYIENRAIGSAPSTLLDYFPDDWLLVVDESHITMPQVRGMYNGDRVRKENLVGFGFRMRAALDNRPLKFTEFNKKLNQTIFISATPADYELDLSGQGALSPARRNQEGKTNVVEQIIRPTGLLDPDIDIRPSETRYVEDLRKYLVDNNYSSMTYYNKSSTGVLNQIDDVLQEINDRVQKKERVLITTLTKRMAEDLSKFMQDAGVAAEYLHSDIDTMERVDILKNLRLGVFDVLIGINLLREGLDLPEVSLVVIFDADKEGFLRSQTSLIQTIGRAARHPDGKVIMYADRITGSMNRAINETFRRRKIQQEYNKKHGIVPQRLQKEIKDQLEMFRGKESDTSSGVPKDLLKKSEIYPSMNKKEKKEYLQELEIQMDIYADMLEFEKAAEVRDLLEELKGNSPEKRK